MSRIVEWVKEHPYYTAGIVAALFALVLYARSGNSSSDNSGTAVDTSGLTTSEVQAGSELQMAQLQAQTQANQTSAAASVYGQQIAGQVTVAQLDAQTAQNNNTLQAQTAQIIAGLEAQTTQAVSTLQAQVSEAQTGAQVQMNANNNATFLGIASLPYSQITQQQATTLENQIQSSANQVNNWSSKWEGGNIITVPTS